MVVGLALLVIGTLVWVRCQIRKPRASAPRHRPF
jgi:hypothetical protein